MEFKVGDMAVITFADISRYRNRVEFKVVDKNSCDDSYIVDIGTEWNLKK